MSTALPAVFELSGITKRYRRKSVLNGLDLRASRGEIIGLLGPNGSGKTTTLRIAAGYIWPDGGSVKVNGSGLAPDNPQSRRSIGYLPERVPLYDAFRVERYLLFVAGARGLARSERQQAVIRVLEAFDLIDVRRQVIAQLSKGYRQRIGLAQALLGEPDVLLLDEPTNGLDPFQIIEARNYIRAASSARAVIISTHIIQEVEALCTRVVYLDRGTLVDLAANHGGDGRERIDCRVATASLQGLLAAVNDFAAAITVLEVVPLDHARYAISFSATPAERSGLARVLSHVGELESYATQTPTLEAQLVSAISRGGDLERQ